MIVISKSPDFLPSRSILGGSELRAALATKGLQLGFGLALALLPSQVSTSCLAQQAATNTPPAQTGSGSTAPSPSHLAAARALVVSSGMSRSFDAIIPQFTNQIVQSLTQTRPEIARDLTAVLTQLKPEFEKEVDEMIDIAAQIYVKQMSEPDLKAAVAFFDSPAGKKYVETQPAFLTEAVTAMQGWQGKVSTDMMSRVRAEMKKRGHEI